VRKSKRLAPEVIERAVRMVAESQPQHGSQWAAVVSIAAKIGCTAATPSVSMLNMNFAQACLRGYLRQP